MVTALTLHPAERRRRMAVLPAEPMHDVVLRPLGGAGPNGVIASADEQSFIDAILADLERSDWRQAITARRGRRRGTDGVLELSQPVHRRQHLILLEAFCREPGSPRVDPAKLVGMGFVLRRQAPTGAPSTARRPGRLILLAGTSWCSPRAWCSKTPTWQTR